MTELDAVEQLQGESSKAVINEQSNKSLERKLKKGGGQFRQDASPSVQLSKALSYILRHGAAKEGLKVRSDGYISLQSVLKRSRVSKIKMENGQSPSEDNIFEVVNSNDKKRFEIYKDEKGETFIRAVQGHSIAEIVELDHVPLTLSNLLILSSSNALEALSIDDEPRLPSGVEILHGTTKDAWEKIKLSGGLNRMKRNHIHLAKGRAGSDSVISGMRNSSSIIIHIDIIAALQDGVPFAVASNGAVLTSGLGDTGILPLKYINLVEEGKTGKTVWPMENDA